MKYPYIKTGVLLFFALLFISCHSKIRQGEAMRLIGDAKTRITLENKQDEYNNATEAGRRELITHYVVGLDFSDFEAVGAINEPPKTIN